jgi:hypothetical protein
MKDPRMTGVEQKQPGFKALKRAAARKSEHRSTRKPGRRHSSKH